MLVSTRGRYVLRVMIDLAEHADNGYTSMKSIAERQEVSLKYIEKTLPLLVAGNMIEGVQGKGGGYKLTRSPEKYKIGDILRITEGDIAPVACLTCDAEPCQKREGCKTILMWEELQKRICDYLDSITLEDLKNGNVKQL